jgi:hypothetical protein
MSRENLSVLAKCFLNEKGQEDIESLLDAGSIRTARLYLLGALDQWLEFKVVSFDVLSIAYKDLGLDPAEIADIRNSLLHNPKSMCSR